MISRTVTKTVSRFGFVGALMALAALSACNNKPYCLNCVDGSPVDFDARTDATGDRAIDTPGDQISTDAADASDVSDAMNRPETCVPGATEVCNGFDDNCDGRTDETFNLQTDPANCGMCGNLCNLPRAIPACTAGRCTIAPNGCDTNFFDLNNDPTDGCEYGCTRVPGATTDSTCDRRDDDCDGRTDEDIDLCTSVNNCGLCGRTCQVDNATARCERVGMGTGVCTVTTARCAIATCNANFYDLNNDPTDGCEYSCTPNGAETCDGRDNNCNGQTDEGNPGSGAACGSMVGECRRGTTQCMNGSLVCMGEVAPSTELCDLKDNDCNGMTDDGTLSGDTRIGMTCGSSVGECRTGRNICMAGAVVCSGQTTPVAETCDGRDNNCNNMIDDGIAAMGSCGTDTGECAVGTLRCMGGNFICQGEVGRRPETCNNLDDDCDGATDNGIDKQSDPNNCGMCGNRCTAQANAIVVCQTGMCRRVACSPNFYDLNGSATDGCEYACTFLSSTEICNGRDDDCDGMTDESITPPTNFCRTTGLCAGSTVTCQGAMGFRCNYPSGVQVDANGQVAAVETRCDGIDNNCNGATDETFPDKGTSCAGSGIGACATSGTRVCSTDNMSTVCNAPAPGTGSAELCNGLDDDCDGVTDENGTAPGTNASFVATAWSRVTPPQNCGVVYGSTTIARCTGAANCNTANTQQCLPGFWCDASVATIASPNTAVCRSPFYMMRFEASRPGATAANPGTLSTRACSATNVMPWTNLTYPQAVAACTAAGGRICRQGEFRAACEGGAACNWSYNATCTTYSSTACNAVDNDIDASMAGVQNGLLPSGAKAACLRTWNATDVLDLSGNAKEFTEAVAGNSTLMGGSYNNQAFGTTCSFNWTAVNSTFRFVNAGFRCCYDGATPP